MASAKSSATSRHFVICVSSGKTPASLEAGKVYERLLDTSAEAVGMQRIVDESGEDYLHPACLFGRVSLPNQTRLALERAASAILHDKFQTQSALALTQKDTMAAKRATKIKRALAVRATKAWPAAKFNRTVAY